MWHVVYTEPCAEQRAAENLTKRGVDVFLPRTKRRQRSARLSTVRWVVVPYFPRYVFADVMDFPLVVDCPGVLRIVGFADVPCPVPNVVMTRLRALFDENGMISASNYYKKDQRVYIRFGAFAGLTGTVLAAHGTVLELLLQMFGQSRTVRVPISLID